MSPLRNRIALMHGVNLDMLGRRDPAHYGTLTLAELERARRRVRARARARGELLPDQLRGASSSSTCTACRRAPTASCINPGAWTHYSWAIHDALEIAGLPAVEVHLSKIDEREPWRAGLGRARPRARVRQRAGRRGLPRGARAAQQGARRVSAARLERLREALAAEGLDALIVQGAANLRYLTGYTGSNGLALVGAAGEDRFFTDFRYASQIDRGARSGVRARDRRRGELLEALAAGARRARASASTTSPTSVRRHARSSASTRPAAVELVAASGPRRATAGGQGRARRSPRSRPRRRSSTGSTRWLFERRARRAHRARGRGRARARDAPARRARPELPLDRRRAAPAGALPHAQPRDVAIERGTLVTIDIGALRDGYCSDCTRTVAVGEPGEHAREIHALVLAAQLAGLAAVAAGRQRPRGRRAGARGDRGRRPRRALRPRPRATASGSRSTRRRGSRASAARPCSCPATS